MKLYSAVFTALRVVNDETEIRIHPMLVSQETPETALQEAQEAMMSFFPPSEQWINHRLFWMEIEQGMTFDDGRRLVWRFEEPSQDTEVPHGKDSTIE